MTYDDVPGGKDSFLDDNAHNERNIINGFMITNSQNPSPGSDPPHGSEDDSQAKTDTETL